jgi:hypothetical protein
MLALFCMTKVTCVAATGAAGENSGQANSGFALSAGRGEVGSKVVDAASIECEIKRHLEAISLYEHEADSSDAQVRVLAERILPQLQRHLALLRSLQSGS